VENNKFTPEISLDHNERGQLTSTAATEGYKVMHRIFRAEVDKFIIDLINANPAEAKAVWAKHILAKAAAQFYNAVTARINEEVLQYTHATRTTDVPKDATEGILDIGEAAMSLDNLDSFGEGDMLYE
jgi:hypothetical protein